MRQWMLAVCGLAAVLAACGPSKKKGEDTITFLHWEDAATQRHFEPLFAEFKKRHPKAKIVAEAVPSGQYIQKLNALMASDDAPDVFYLQLTDLIYYAVKGELEPLNAYLQQDTEVDTKKFIPSVLEAVSYRGSIYAFPKGCHTFALYYNKDLFDAEGLPYPDATWSYEKEFLEAAKRLTKDEDGDGRIDRFGFKGFGWFESVNTIYGFGGGILSRDGTRILCSSPETVRAVQFMYDCLYKHKIFPRVGELGTDAGIDLFEMGKAAMQIMGFWVNLPYREKAPDLNYDVAFIPRGPKGDRTALLLATAFFVSSKSKNKQLAYEFVKLMAGPVGTRHWTSIDQDIPAYLDEEALKIFLDSSKKPANRKVFLDSMAFSFAPKYHINEVFNAWFQEYDQAVLSPKKTPAKAMADAYQRVRQAINEFKAKIGEPPIN